MFRTEAIILHTQAIRDNQVRLIVFSKEFWKVTIWQKRKLIPEIWSICELTIERKWKENILQSIEIQRIFPGDGQEYKIVLEFLELLSSLYHSLPEGLCLEHIYQDCHELISNLSDQGKNNHDILMLTHFRILKKLWYIGEPENGNEVISYVYQEVSIKSMKSILCTKPLNLSIKLYLQSAILKGKNFITLT